MIQIDDFIEVIHRDSDCFEFVPPHTVLAWIEYRALIKKSRVKTEASNILEVIFSIYICDTSHGPLTPHAGSHVFHGLVESSRSKLCLTLRRITWFPQYANKATSQCVFLSNSKTSVGPHTRNVSRLFDVTRILIGRYLFRNYCCLVTVD